MNAPTRPTTLAGNHRLEIRRLIDAPRERVFQMWTDAERMTEWMTMGGTAQLDAHAGGKFHLDMHYEGKSYDHDGEYLEITPPSKIVFTWISASTNRLPSIVTVELFDRGGKTELVLTHEGLPDQKNADDHKVGWTEIVVLLEKAVL